MVRGVVKRRAQTEQLTTFLVPNGAARLKDFPTRFKIFDWGPNSVVDGRPPVIVNEYTAKVFAGLQHARGRDRVALDFEHNTVPGSIEYERSQEPRDVAAHFTPVVVPGDGIYLEAGEYTPVGREKAPNYRGLSPAPKLNARGEVEWLHSVALTRRARSSG